MRLVLHEKKSLAHVVSGLRQTCTWYYLPTPPLGQDMTQGQFLSRV